MRVAAHVAVDDDDEKSSAQWRGKSVMRGAIRLRNMFAR